MQFILLTIIVVGSAMGRPGILRSKRQDLNEFFVSPCIKECLWSIGSKYPKVNEFIDITDDGEFSISQPTVFSNFTFLCDIGDALDGCTDVCGPKLKPMHRLLRDGIKYVCDEKREQMAKYADCISESTSDSIVQCVEGEQKLKLEQYVQGDKDEQTLDQQDQKAQVGCNNYVTLMRCVAGHLSDQCSSSTNEISADSSTAAAVRETSIGEAGSLFLTVETEWLKAFAQVNEDYQLDSSGPDTPKCTCPFPETGRCSHS